MMMGYFDEGMIDTARSTLRISQTDADVSALQREDEIQRKQRALSMIEGYLREYPKAAAAVGKRTRVLNQRDVYVIALTGSDGGNRREFCVSTNGDFYSADHRLISGYAREETLSSVAACILHLVARHGSEEIKAYFQKSLSDDLLP